MAFVTNYQFNNLGRIGNDDCAIDINSIENQQSCNYMLQNYFLRDCNMNQVKNFATAQPGINYSGAFGMAPGGCNVNDNSDLTIGTIQTHPRARIDLFGRPFATIPYLGRGSVDSGIEYDMLIGERNTNKRSVTNMMEKSHWALHATPFHPDVQKYVHGYGEITGVNPDYFNLDTKNQKRDTQFHHK